MRFDPTGDVAFQLESLLNEGLELNDNFRGGLLETDLVIGDNTVQHGLGFIPIGYIVLFPGNAVDESGVVVTPHQVVKREDGFLLFLPGGFGSGAAFTGIRVSEWTTETLFLSASVASEGTRLFVV